MKISKRVLTQLEGCYATSSFRIKGKNHVLIASEAKAPCMAWEGPDYEKSHKIWDGPGGTMSVVPIPGTDGEFLAVQKFYRMYDWEEAVIVHVKPQDNGEYAVKELIKLPYIHRFDLLTVDGRYYLIACTLATTKDSYTDWSNPGKILVGEYTGPDSIELKVLKDGLTKNHGYSRLEKDGKVCGLVTCNEGAFEVSPPAKAGEQWRIHQFMDWPISDISAIDIDQDGELEFATIEDFHGSYFRVYKKIDGMFKKVFEHPEVTEFYHVVVGARLAGEPVFIGGCRRGKQQLFMVRLTDKNPLTLTAEIIDEGVGPSNAFVIHEDSRDTIIVANRETNEAALYFVSKT